MKPERSTLGGFQNPTPGWHSFEITERVGWRTEKDADGKPTEEIADGHPIMFFCSVIDDEEEGRNIVLSFLLDKDGGRASCARFLHYCKLDTILEKEFGITNNEMNEKEWGDKCLNPEGKKAQQLINSIFSKAPGKVFRGKVENSKGKADDQGNIPTYTNITDLDYYGGTKKAAKGSAKATASAAATAPAPAAAEDDEGW